MAPEIVQGRVYNESVDVWMSGVLMYEMLVGKAPFTVTGKDGQENTQETFARIEACKLMMPKYLSAQAQDLLKRMVVKDPQKRLPIQDVLKHHWIQKWGMYEDYRAVEEEAMPKAERAMPRRWR
jgi:serine/threonine protein kinase